MTDKEPMEQITREMYVMSIAINSLAKLQRLGLIEGIPFEVLDQNGLDEIIKSGTLLGFKEPTPSELRQAVELIREMRND